MTASAWNLIAIFFLLFLSAFFSASEVALLTVNRITLKHMAEQKSGKAHSLLLLKQNPNRFISAILIGNNIANIFAASVGTRLAILLAPESTTFLMLSTFALTIIIVIFGEMLPKSFANNNPLRVSFLVYYPIRLSITLFYPLVLILEALNHGLMKLLGLKNVHSTSIITDQRELETMIDISQEEGILEQDERAIIKSVFEFSDTRVYEIMVQRVDMVSLDISKGIMGFMELIKTTGYSRVPVYENEVDNILGIAFTKDVMQEVIHNKAMEDIDLKKLIRKAHFVPESKKVDELFKLMRETRQHMVMAVDEYGGISGLITMEDILEELVGEIQDEYDTEEPYFRKLDDTSYEIAGNYPIDDLNELLEISLPTEECDTISGYLLAELGHIPVAGEKVFTDQHTFIVSKIEGRRIVKVVAKAIIKEDSECSV
ncbi:MAG TPA: hemolysin family protein [Caldisericia bacterium]|nr:hemolysin family protein [Caldisericia bacterium]